MTDLAKHTNFVAVVRARAVPICLAFVVKKDIYTEAVALVANAKEVEHFRGRRGFVDRPDAHVAL